LIEEEKVGLENGDQCFICDLREDCREGSKMENFAENDSLSESCFSKVSRGDLAQ